MAQAKYKIGDTISYGVKIPERRSLDEKLIIEAKEVIKTTKVSSTSFNSTEGKWYYATEDWSFWVNEDDIV